LTTAEKWFDSFRRRKAKSTVVFARAAPEAAVDYPRELGAMPEIIVKLGEAVVQKYSFDKEAMRVGRGRDNDIVLENLQVSRNHAEIRKENDRFVLVDLQSANGTFINGVRVSKTEILDNDVVAIGKHQL